MRYRNSLRSHLCVRNTSLDRRESTASLSILELRTRARANARRPRAAPTPAVSIAKALPSNELQALSIPNILRSRGVEWRATMCRCTGCSSRGRWRWGGHCRWGHSCAGSEAATCLAGLELGAGAGADSGGVCAAAAAAVGVAEALAADELATMAVADVLYSRRVKGGSGEGGEGDWRLC